MASAHFNPPRGIFYLYTHTHTHRFPVIFGARVHARAMPPMVHLGLVLRSDALAHALARASGA